MVAPRLIATWSFAARACAAEWPGLAGGDDPLDVAERVVATVELDPSIDSVGLGGWPDAEGAMTLDAIVMRSPSRIGAVGALAGRCPAVHVARAVLDRTPHTLVAGPGAARLADAAGVAERELLTDEARAAWDAWRARGGHAAEGPPPPRPVDRGDGRLFEARPAEGHDTVCVLSLGTAGDLAGATATSGVPWKHPGRIGDSPIVGHGLYVDPDHGAAAATGYGELASGSCVSFLAVERMRAGDDPVRALTVALERVAEQHALRPHQQLAMIALAPDGRVASAALRPGFLAVVARPGGLEVTPPDHVVIPGPD